MQIVIIEGKADLGNIAAHLGKPSVYGSGFDLVALFQREIIKELDKKPIVIKILNIRVDTARDLVFKIYNKTNDIVKSVILCEKIIIYGNRYRSTSEKINEALEEATDLFRKGKYKQSMDLSLKAISEVDNNVYTRFGLEQ